MNELLFLVQALLVSGFALLAMRLGKTALTAWICLQAVLANLFVLKQISFFGFFITCSDVFAVGSLLGLNLVREFYGKDAAYKALYASFFCMAFFVVMAYIHLFYLPSPQDTAHAAYKTLLAPSARLLGASILCFFLTQQLDIRIFGALQKLPLPLALRSPITLLCSQLLDTVLFSYLGLYGLLSPLGDILLISFLVKILIILVSSSFLSLAKRWQRAV